MTITQPTRPDLRPGPDMVWIPGGTFLMGSDHHYPEEAPAHRVTVDGFWIDRHTVTNANFARFVRKTGHLTVAEQAPDAADYPGARPELLVPASMVFRAPAHRVDLGDHYNWWTYVPGASWRHPQGPGSSIKKKPDHPVVQVAWADVAAYAAWAGKELPTEAEWELACRGGLDGATFAWGEELNPEGRWMANTWQGEFPIENLELDGYAGTAPVGRYPANGYGLHDMIGNVWEWTSDWYQTHRETSHACCTVTNPRGGDRQHSRDPGTSHLGFRCILRPEVVCRSRRRSVPWHALWKRGGPPARRRARLPVHGVVLRGRLAGADRAGQPAAAIAPPGPAAHHGLAPGRGSPGRLGLNHPAGVRTAHPPSLDAEATEEPAAEVGGRWRRRHAAGDPADP